MSCVGLPRLHSAIIKASMTIWAVMPELMDQPTARREYKSSTTATYSQPSAVQT